MNWSPLSRYLSAGADPYSDYPEYPEFQTVNDVTAEHEQALGRMMTVAAKIARDEGLADDGYRLIVNCNRHGGQEVYHIHMHLLGGRPLGPMLAHKG